MFLSNDPQHPMPYKKVGVILWGILMVSLITWVGLKSRNTFREYAYIGTTPQRNTITVSGQGKVVAIPDIAILSLGTTIEQPTVSQAQQENTKVMNAIIDKLKTLGVDSKDIQTTNYSIYPAYDYTNNKQTIRGYTVTQNVTVKIRKLSSVSEIIAAAGTLGANQVSGLTFTVDQPEQYREKARIEALKNARAKADALAKVVGITLRRVVSFNESGTMPVPGPYSYLGEGGGGMMMDRAMAPTVEAGSNDVVVDASVTYEIE